MLLSLSVSNLLLIDKLDLELQTSLCALTGETGTGKSILLDALGLALGSRAETGFIRPGAEHAHVTAEFDIDGIAMSYFLASCFSTIYLGIILQKIRNQ